MELVETLSDTLYLSPFRTRQTALMQNKKYFILHKAVLLLFFSSGHLLLLNFWIK